MQQVRTQAVTHAENRGERPNDALFDAILYPHRSLSPRGFLILMAAITCCSIAIGTAFWIAGAWPVFGFFGLDVLLIYITFRLSYRDARRYETVHLTRAALTVERFVRGRRVMEKHLQPYWLNVGVEEERSGPDRLMLRTHGQSLEIGAFLSPPEKQEFADSLTSALKEVRSA
tara:strand:+ start:191 stop:709 length:519 start_codon:yes stop_codon:yes gene_type:complete